MAGIIPKNKIKGVDFCATMDYFYIIRSDLGCYMKVKDFHKGSEISIHALHPSCQDGDHYLGDRDYFYIIKGDDCRRVTDLTADTDSSVFTLHPNCRGGDHYLVFVVIHLVSFFLIIFQEKGTIRGTPDLSKDTGSELPLPPNWRDGLYYWSESDHVYFLKLTSKWGVEYCKCTGLNRDVCTAVYSVHPDVLNFLPGGLSVTIGPAFGKWKNIKTISNDSPTPVKWQKKVTKKVGYNKEKMSEITHNWKIAASFSISSGELSGLITKAQFSFSAEYGGASVKTEKENWTEETEDEETLSFELKPNQSLYVWQYQLGLGSDPVLFCKDLKITDKPNPPTEVPLLFNTGLE